MRSGNGARDPVGLEVGHAGCAAELDDHALAQVDRVPDGSPLLSLMNDSGNESAETATLICFVALSFAERVGGGWPGCRRLRSRGNRESATASAAGGKNGGEKALHVVDLCGGWRRQRRHRGEEFTVLVVRPRQQLRGERGPHVIVHAKLRVAFRPGPPMRQLARFSAVLVAIGMLMAWALPDTASRGVADARSHQGAGLDRLLLPQRRAAVLVQGPRRTHQGLQRRSVPARRRCDPEGARDARAQDRVGVGRGRDAPRGRRDRQGRRRIAGRRRSACRGCRRSISACRSSSTAAACSCARRRNRRGWPTSRASVSQ